MMYDIAKSVHIVSVLVWVAGMAVGAMTLCYPSSTSLPAVQGFDRKVTTPAMLLVWTFGIYLAIQGGWFGQTWLSAKILSVLILSGLHGMIAGRLRRATWESGTKSDPSARLVLLVGFGVLIVIVVLVTTKLP